MWQGIRFHMFNASFPTVPGRHGVLVSGEASVQPRTGALHSLARTWLRVSRLNRREKNTEDRRKDVLHAFLFYFFFRWWCLIYDMVNVWVMFPSVHLYGTSGGRSSVLGLADTHRQW